MSLIEDKQNPGEVKSAGIPELTHVVIGRRMSMTALNDLLGSIKSSESTEASANDATWVGSVGYENHRDVDEFAQMLADAGVEKLIDVRELPMSRRRGFAKSALSAALAGAGVEYLHLKAMGNPKEFRDLYKSGQVDAGRNAYQRFLLSERHDDLKGLNHVIREKRCALMCVEDDPAICHRQVILDMLSDKIGLELDIARIG
jgi:uncharacterized protein (DUF488 family)